MWYRVLVMKPLAGNTEVHEARGAAVVVTEAGHGQGLADGSSV